MHDLLRRYALDHCPPEGDPEREAAWDRLVEHYLHTAYRGAVLQFPKRNPIVVPLQTPPPAVVPLTDADAASQWFEAELAALRSLVAATADTRPTAAWQLAWSLVGHYTKTGRYREMTAIQTVALLAAERLGHAEAQAYALDRRQWALCGRATSTTRRPTPSARSRSTGGSASNSMRRRRCAVWSASTPGAAITPRVWTRHSSRSH